MISVTRTRLPFLAMLLSACLSAGCMTKPTGYSDYDLTTDFSTFETFAFVPQRTLIVASPNPPNPALEPALRQETRRFLERQGFRYSESANNADFLVGFVLGGTPTIRTTAFVSSYRQVYVVGQTQGSQVVTQESTEAGLVIDIIDRASDQKKWMGWTVREITMADQKRLSQTVRDAVGVILQHFPPEVPEGR